MNLVDKLERKFQRFGVHNLTLYIVIGQVVIFALGYSNPQLFEKLVLVPDQVLAGEVWRLVTFAVMVPTSSPIWAFFAVYLFYIFGTALEGLWGPFRYTLYLLVGYVFTVAAAFLWPHVVATNLYLESIVFLAFAFLFPSYELLLFFILPVKVKWLALLTWLLYAYTFVVGQNHDRAMILAAVSSFLLYFGKDLTDAVKNRKRGADNRAQWKRKMREADNEREDNGVVERSCEVCGETDKSAPNTLFFFADDGRCFCEKHKGQAELPAQPKVDGDAT